MARVPLSQLEGWTLENRENDVRGWPLRDANGQTLGVITELLVNTDTHLVETLTLDNGMEVSTKDIQFGDHEIIYRSAASTSVGTTGTSAGTQSYSRESGETSVPIIEEELEIGKRRTQSGGIRVTTHVHEQPVSEDVRLRDETVHVYHETVDRPATEADLAQMRDQTFEVTETSEEAVVRKEARVTGEVHIEKEVEERTERIEDTVRRTEVDVENLSDEERKRRSQS